MRKRERRVIIVSKFFSYKSLSVSNTRRSNMKSGWKKRRNEKSRRIAKAMYCYKAKSHPRKLLLRIVRYGTFRTVRTQEGKRRGGVI